MVDPTSAPTNARARPQKWCVVTRCALSLSFQLNAGAIYVLDLLMGFAMGFTVEHNLKRRVIMRPDLIARYYVLHNTFTTDFISAMAIIPEVNCCMPGLSPPSPISSMIQS